MMRSGRPRSVCEGSVSFGLLSEEHLTAHAVATAELELTHIPGPRECLFCIALKAPPRDRPGLHYFRLYFPINSAC
jgi:hypothetical protein